MTGQWFLDEFVSTTRNVNSMVRLLDPGQGEVLTALCSTEKFVGKFDEKII